MLRRHPYVEMNVADAWSVSAWTMVVGTGVDPVTSRFSGAIRAFLHSAASSTFC